MRQYTNNQKIKIVEDVLPLMQTMSCTQACIKLGVSKSNFVRWIDTLPHIKKDAASYKVQYARAIDDHVEMLAQEIMDIADEIPGKIDGRMDNAEIQNRRLRIDSRKWLLSKIASKKYGDRLQLASDEENPLIPNNIGNQYYSVTVNNYTKEEQTKINKTSTQYSEESAQIQAFEILALYPRLHLGNYVHRTADNAVLNFYDNEWQQKLYMENADKAVVMKASKTGVSEWLLCDVFTQAKMGRSGMYILPDQPIRNRFVTSRVDKIIGNTVEYRNNVSKNKKEVDSKSLKTIYGKDWAFVGANNPGTFYEFNSDVNIYDEFDKCNVLSLETATDRTLGSEEDRWRKVGNPTIAGFGIDDEFEKSCQYIWHIKCTHCGEWQSLDWFVNFVNQEDDNVYTLKDKTVLLSSPVNDGDDALGYCRHCDKPIDRLSKGEWIAKYLEREIKGYHATRLFASIARNRNTIREDFDKMKDCLGNLTLMQWFYNNRLGISYEADGSKITEALLSECVLSDYVMPDHCKEISVGGADVGTKIHITASVLLPDGRRKKVCICSIPLNMELFEGVIKKYNMRRGVIDALPEQGFVKEFLARNKGWKRCFYGKKDETNIRLKVTPKEKKVNVDRTESLDSALALYVNHDKILPRNVMSIDNGDFAKQMVAPTRVYDDKTQRFIWVTKKADHYRHADNYENIAYQVMRGGGTMSLS